MAPLKIKNEYGETIEIKYDADGVIKIRHSDIDRKFWGKLHEHSKRIRQPKFQAFLAGKGIAPNDPAAKEMAEELGGYMIIRGKSYIISAAELALIHGAIKQAGGIIPNWSNQP